MSETNDVTTDNLDEARDELRRAYLQVSFGKYPEAIAACERAAQLAPDHHLPATLKGSFEMAAGRVRDALGTLRGVTRRHDEEALPQIYFAEACFMAGRRRQGERALDKAEALLDSQELADLIDSLRQTWASVDADELPPPLVVELVEEESRGGARGVAHAD